MNKIELMELEPEILAEIILSMGHIIRKLDDDNEYLEYWTQDGEYITDIPINTKRLSNISSPHYHNWESGTYYHHSHKGGAIPHGHDGSRYGMGNKDEQIRQGGRNE